MIGDADAVRPEHAVQMVRLLPHAQLAVLPGMDHFAPVQRPDWIVSMIKAFLAHGSASTARLVQEYQAQAAQIRFTSADQLNELAVMVATLDQIPYRRLLIAYAGSMEIPTQEDHLAEFDGIIFLLGKTTGISPILIAEAKNTPNGYPQARKRRPGWQRRWAIRSIPNAARRPCDAWAGPPSSVGSFNFEIACRLIGCCPWCQARFEDSF
jgi:hypothetical protein